MSRPNYAGHCRTCCAPAALAIGAALLLPASALFASTARAQQSQGSTLPPVVVQQKKNKPVKKPAQSQAQVAAPAPAPAEAAQREADQSIAAAPANSTTINSDAIADKKPATNDTAQLFSGTPGVAFATNGGVSSWPAIHGLADERVRTELDGMPLTSACPNHMNPVLSYADPASVGKVQVIAGITPVSAGGDSLGGTIRVDSAAPRFAAVPGEVITYGSVSVFVRSNGDGISTGGSVSAATSNINVTYTGSWAKSSNYKDGHGDTVYSTRYETENHKLSVAVRDNSNLLVIEAGAQHIPYQGFPNEYMNMTGNDSYFINGHYIGQFNWGKLDLRAYYQNTWHQMNLDSEGNKLGYMGGFPMPMNTHGQNFGYSAKADLPQSSRDMLRIGSEFHGVLLNDTWPSVPGTMGMCCNYFVNMNGGRRYDLGTFVEWERKWDSQWSTLVGIRNDTIWMNTGTVQGYNTTSMYQPDANTFNKEDRARSFADFDATALARYQASPWSTFEGGYSMKTRAPSLYELYDWSSNGMAAEMNGWAGDGNRYIGNINLKAETAHTVSLTYDVHDAGSYKDSGASREWVLKVTPYYSYVDNYIDVRRCSIPGAANAKCTPGGAGYTTNQSLPYGSVYLQYVNQDAEIYGADIYGRMPLLRNDEIGKFSLVGVAGYDRGNNLTSGGGLYHMMPLNAKLTLQHNLGNWSNAAEVQLVANKDNVETVRNELQTPGYAVVNLRSSYLWGNVRFDLGVENLFNQQYYSPLGGAYLGNQAAGYAGWQDKGSFTPLAGMGRNIYAGVTVKF